MAYHLSNPVMQRKKVLLRELLIQSWSHLQMKLSITVFALVERMA